MHHICQDCEKRIMSECCGLDTGTPDKYTESCYLENVYGLAADSGFLQSMEEAYKKDAADWTPEEARIAYLRDICGMDVHMLGDQSPLYPLWNLFRSVSVLHCLEIYQMLDVTLTLKDTRGESFYAGIPQVSPEDIRGAKRVLKHIKENGFL